MNFFMVYLINKISVLLKDSLSKRFFKEYSRLLLFVKKLFSEHLMMKSSRLEKDKKVRYKIMKDIRNLFRLKKKENEAIKDRMIRDIRNIFENVEKYYYKPGRVGNFWSNNCIEYESNGDRNKTISVEEYLNNNSK